MMEWAAKQQVRIHHIQPGKTQQSLCVTVKSYRQMLVVIAALVAKH